MDDVVTALSALADPRRLRILELLAERPRSVGVVAELAGLRQPQASKDLHRLVAAGLVSCHASGQRRIYALETAPLRELAGLIDGLADTGETRHSDRSTFDAYQASRAAEMLTADRDRWADDRVFTFDRVLSAPRTDVWHHLTEPDLLARWWAPRDLAVSDLSFDPRPGGRIVLEYRDADDTTGTDGVVGRAEGEVVDIAQPDRLAYTLSPLLPDGALAFTGHYAYDLTDHHTGTQLDVRLRISNSTIAGAEFIAGIEIGWNQCLDQLTAAVAASAPAHPNQE